MTERRAMTPDEVANTVDIAIIKTKMDQVEKSNLEQNKKLDSMAATLAEISRTMEQARGGWRTLLWLGGAAGAAGSALAWFIGHIKW